MQTSASRITSWASAILQDPEPEGAAFDRRYIQEMVTGHTKAIAIYTKESADAQNPALKSYVEQALPVLQKHLEDAKALQKSTATTKGM